MCDDQQQPHPSLYFEVDEALRPHLRTLMEYLEHLPPGREGLLLAHALAQLTGIASYKAAHPAQEEEVAKLSADVAIATALALGGDDTAMRELNNMNAHLQALGGSEDVEVTFHGSSNPTH